MARGHQGSPMQQAAHNQKAEPDARLRTIEVLHRATGPPTQVHISADYAGRQDHRCLLRTAGATSGPEAYLG